MKLEINDIYGTKITVNNSRSGYYRLDFNTDDWPEYIHEKTQDVIPYCISMTYEQANLLNEALSFLLKQEEIEA